MKKFPKKFGFAFWESLEVSRKRKIIPAANELAAAENWLGKNFSQGKTPPLSFEVSAYRLIPIYFLFAACFLVLLARSFDLQVIQGKIFLGKAEGNRISLEVSHAP